MKYITHILKLDKWLTKKITEESWVSVIVNVMAVIVGYSGFYWLPEIVLILGGGSTKPLEYKWYMMLANFFCSIILIFTLFKIVRLLRKKPTNEQVG